MPLPQKFLKKLFPIHKFRDDKSLSVFGEFLHDQNIWHLNRRSVACAFAIGLFCAFIPLPFQMGIAAGFAIIFRCNLPISVALVWITNPITMPALFFLAYKIGTWLTGTYLGHFEFELSLNWLFTELRDRWYPFLVGCLFVGFISALLGYITVRIMWRIQVVSFWKERKFRKIQRKLKK